MLVVSFKYNGGSHPGTRRTVFMRLDSANGWRGVQAGLDLELNEWRSFNRLKATDIEAHKGTEVDLSVMPKGFDAKGLERQFQAEGKLTFRDGNKLVAYEKPKPVAVMKPFANNGGGLDIRTPKGTVHVMGGNNGFNVFTYDAKGHTIKDVFASTNPADLLAALKAVLE